MIDDNILQNELKNIKCYTVEISFEMMVLASSEQEAYIVARAHKDQEIDNVDPEYAVESKGPASNWDNYGIVYHEIDLLDDITVEQALFLNQYQKEQEEKRKKKEEAEKHQGSLF